MERLRKAAISLSRVWGRDAAFRIRFLEPLKYLLEPVGGTSESGDCACKARIVIGRLADDDRLLQAVYPEYPLGLAQTVKSGSGGSAGVIDVDFEPSRLPDSGQTEDVDEVLQPVSGVPSILRSDRGDHEVLLAEGFNV